MFPHDILPGINLYVICLGLAAVAAVVCFGKLADVANINGKVQNMSIYTAVAAILVGYGSAVLFQAFYNMLAGEGFLINSGTGATFYGGLIGGIVGFILIYFLWDKNRQKIRFLWGLWQQQEAEEQGSAQLRALPKWER